jgi:transcriptional regulator with XRE-family HTH domain
MARLTPFGKLVRKHRIDHGLLLKDMADRVGRSAPFLSAVETGEKQIPADLVDQVINAFQCSAHDAAALRSAAEQSQREFKISVGKAATDSQREVAAMFARRFKSLTEADLAKFKEVLIKRQG